MLKIKDNVDLKILKKYGFKEILMNKKLYYIYNPTNLNYLTGNSIKVYGDRTIYDIDRQIGMDRIIKIEIIKGSLDADKIIDLIYDLIISGIIEKIKK